MQRLWRGLIRAMGGDDPPVEAKHAVGDSPPVDETRAARAEMVERQLRSRGITDERVLAAILAVPRDAFVPERYRRSAHADDALPIEEGQTISQPYIVARMTELLRVGPGDRVLDVGTGSGYQAAILAEIGCHVVSLERIPALADSARDRLERLGYGDRVEVRTGDGSVGDAAGAPWRGIVVAAATPGIPDALRTQLHPDGGRMVLPVGTRDRQDLITVERRGDEWLETNDGAVMFVPLIGAEGFAAES
jgi:protein-L-isoaspartate(D-aspartate) O-methyltransferase